MRGEGGSVLRHFENNFFHPSDERFYVYKLITST